MTDAIAMKLAFVFPGQGSQAVGMLDSLTANPVVAQMIIEADDALGEPLSTLIEKGPADALALTVNTQPAMLLAGLACYRAWRAAGGADASAFAGHSLGEYTALTAAGVFDLSSALKLVRLRAQAMQEAVPVGTGGMAVILGLDDELVREACREASESFGAMPGNTGGDSSANGHRTHVVEPANFNAPAQVVIAGSTAALGLACEIAKKKGAKRAMPLAVSAPFHSSLLKPAGDRLGVALKAISMHRPTAPVINNVDVTANFETDAIIDALVRQAHSPVRWVEVVLALQAMGITHVIEFGPGKVLGGMIKRIAPELKVGAVFDAASLESTLRDFA
jgi:[acyl-carrier-protein] S-malonyltransferase